jgi:hypothetical protein
LNHSAEEHTTWFEHFNVIEEDKRMMLDQDTIANVHKRRGIQQDPTAENSQNRRHTIKYYRALPTIVRDQENDKLL